MTPAMKHIISAVCAAFGLFHAIAKTPASPIKTSAEAEALPNVDFAKGLPFDLTATVIGVYKDGTIFLEDSGGYFRVVSENISHLKPGDVTRLTGITKYKEDSSEVRDLVATSIVAVGTMPIPKPTATSVSEIANNTASVDFVRVRGKITDAFVDEIDANWNYMILKDEEDLVSVAVANTGDMRNRLAGFVDAEAELTGAVYSGHAGFRIFLGPFLQLWDESCIQILTPAPKDPFSLPRINEIRDVSPSKIAAMGRRTAVGEMIALWGDGKALVKEDDGRIVGVYLANSTSHPSVGDRISVVGYPETDLYRINLSRAQFRLQKAGANSYEEPEDVTPETILLDERGRQVIKPNYHGRLVRMSGLVRVLPAEAGEERLAYIECGRHLVPVDVSARPEITKGIAIGCRVDIVGVCILESPNWRPNMVFPRIDRLVLVPRRAEDIHVLSHPPWWTPRRLLVFIAALVTALIAILVWNFALRRIAERRGRELFRSEISKASAELRIDERTRLAAELHDAIAQNLTGISLQIAAARSAHTAAPEAEERHLAVADQMLRSSRVELRRCIWDLRSEALDVPNLAEAIRRTLQPVIGKAALIVKCGIPRTKLSDTTAHSLLRIVRELTSNAVMHGAATEVTVECSEDGGIARFTVRDNGSGFDPENYPGQTEGHFGLKGVRERVKRLCGTLAILSAKDRGTEVTIKINMN